MSKIIKDKEAFSILIVDDDLRLRELLKDYLTEKKLDVYEDSRLSC